MNARLTLTLVSLLALSLFRTDASKPRSPEPKPSLAPPAGSTAPIRDLCANFWTLSPASGGDSKLLLLPAQNPTAWVESGVAGIEPGAWTAVEASEDGFVWLSKKDRSLKFDPRRPGAGAVEAVKPHEVANAWHDAARMPASNHDLTGAVLNGKFYVSGGLTADWGFPARPHAFDELWELNPQTWTWSVAAKLGRLRIYCATAAFDGKIWVIGGDVVERAAMRRAVTTVELYDPRTRKIEPGPSPQFARPMPIAMAGAGRLYVMGAPRNEYDKPSPLESIGPGETSWRREPDGPAGMSALAGAALDDRLYVLIPKTGLAAFDAKARRWETINSPSAPRSCQMAAYRGVIWMMGGVDVQDGAQTLIYNPKTRDWRKGPPLPRALSWGAAGVVDDTLIFTGGAGLRSPTDRIYIYNDRTFALRPDNRR
jgi:hypothetical protein